MKADLFHIIKLGATVKVEGVTVHAIDANHCPGALQLVFQVGDRTYIHSGDFALLQPHEARTDTTATER